jgi:TonB family protein
VQATTSKVAIVALLIASCLAQNAPEQAASAAGVARSRGTVSSGDVEVLSNTTGVDFGPYLSRLVREVRDNWYRIMPDSVRLGFKKGKLAIQFYILKDGRVTGMQLTDSSGDVVLDRAAWTGVTACDPFPPLPIEFSGKYLKLRLTFRYNPSVSISPSGHVRVPAGTSQQFSANVKTVGNESVNWSVVGSGCDGAGCGTISTTGLYTAPASVPHPARVTVTATLASDPAETASTRIDIIQPAPSAAP